MQTPLLDYIQKEKLFLPSDTILLAVSGGIDSVAMCKLFHKTRFKFGIAHCNFKLRGEESDLDELFVKELSKKYNVPFHSISFNTASFSKKNKLSIQVAARQLRYDWFEEIRQQYHYKFIATAHHQYDSIETFFINLIRGTGIAGLHGILPKHGNIIRPLLFATKEQIKAFVKTNKLNYREDGSNQSDKYLRNKIRHHLVPLLKELNPSINNTISSNMEHFRAVESIYKKDIESNRLRMVTTHNGIISIPIQSLMKLNPVATYLYEFLKPYHFNFTTAAEIIEVLHAASGKQFFSETHRLIKDRDFLLLEPKQPQSALITNEKQWLIEKDQKKVTLDTSTLQFTTKRIINNQQPTTNSNSIHIDYDQLTFPLEIRKWKKGDFFYPLGMKGKKKLSDFFIDKKLSMIQKENTYLLTSNNTIVWVIGLRIDDRFKITNQTKKIYFVELVE